MYSIAPQSLICILHLSLVFCCLYVLMWHPGHFVVPASLSLLRPAGGRGGPQIHVLCGLKGSGCRPSGLDGSVFHGGFWNMPGQDKHSLCGLFKMASRQPPHCRCIEWTPPSAHFSLNVYCEQECRNDMKGGTLWTWSTWAVNINQVEYQHSGSVFVFICLSSHPDGRC